MNIQHLGSIVARVHITQCLCPKRHCIMAIAWEEPNYTPKTAIEKLREIVYQLLTKKILNPWCGICRSRIFRYEDGITEFKSLDEAMPRLREAERDNQISRQFFDLERN